MNSSKAVGTLWTDYDDQESEAHFEADVARFIKREDQIMFEFAGHDPDEGAYTGWCKLARAGEQWVGKGEFFFPPSDHVPARVVANLTSDNTYYFLTGDWLDQGDRQSADLEVEIMKSTGGTG